MSCADRPLSGWSSIRATHWLVRPLPYALLRKNNNAQPILMEFGSVQCSRRSSSAGVKRFGVKPCSVLLEARAMADRIRATAIAALIGNSFLVGSLAFPARAILLAITADKARRSGIAGYVFLALEFNLNERGFD